MFPFVWNWRIDKINLWLAIGIGWRWLAMNLKDLYEVMRFIYILIQVSGYICVYTCQNVWNYVPKSVTLTVHFTLIKIWNGRGLTEYYGWLGFQQCCRNSVNILVNWYQFDVHNESKQKTTECLLPLFFRMYCLLFSLHVSLSPQKALPLIHLILNRVKIRK